MRLINALKPRPPFQVLVMSEESRFGREQIETAYALKQIMDAGVRVFFYLEDRERYARLGHGQDDAVADRLRGRDGAREGAPADYDAMHRKAAARQVADGVV
jgi:hypothetical protein